MKSENLFFGGMGLGIAMAGVHPVINIFGLALALICAFSPREAQKNEDGDEE